MVTRMNGNLGFVEDISTLVSDQEQVCMKSLSRGGFDLRSWSDVEPRANLILQRLRGENGLALMPPGGWSAEKITRFENWVTEGKPKFRGDVYSGFFRSIDAQTEYFDVYGSNEGLEDMNPYYLRFFGRDPLLLLNQWNEYMKLVPNTPILKKQKEAQWKKIVDFASDTNVKEGLLKIDEWLCGLIMQHFSLNEVLDVEMLFDAFARFGADLLPEDHDRVERVKRLGDPSDYRLTSDFARFHRMDSQSMWFVWFGHLHCTHAALGTINTGRETLRAILLAALFVGQTIDTAYRPGSNLKTRDAYKGDHGKEIILATAKILATDWDSATEEMEQLYHIWHGLVPA